MGAIKKFVTERGLGYWLSFAAIALGFVALGLYYKCGVNDFATELSSSVIAAVWAAAALAVIAFVIDLKVVRYVSYLVYLYAFIAFIGTQVNYIANVLVSIDGNSFTPDFLGAAICFALAAFVMLAAAITTRVAPWHKAEDEQNDLEVADD